jgi:hypothetical protein
MRFKNFMSEGKEKGTYAGVRIRYANQLQKEMQKTFPDIEIIKPELMHCTLLYSKKFLPNYKPDPTIEHEAKIKGLEVWDTFDKKRALVVTLDCPSLVQRHKDLMKDHEAIYDYPEYKPHFTLSYDIGDLPQPEMNVNRMLGLVLTAEYDEELKLEWKPK